VQSLVYIFIALAGFGVGAAAYFGLTFTPIESLVVAVAFIAVAVIMLERTLRRRAEARLERAIEDLSRLLSTDAQAGAVLGQRINALTDLDAGRRLETLEADVSVLGTVVRQVAEAVADLEEARKRQARREAPPAIIRRPVVVEEAPADVAAEAPAEPPVEAAPAVAPKPPEPERDPEPVIPLETLKQAIDEGRLVFHLVPIVTLPQRKAAGYDLMPRLMLEEGELADPPDFMPRRGGESVIRRIERLALEEAVTIARRARTSGQPATLHVPVSRATLVDAATIDKGQVLLEANRAIAGAIVLNVADAEWGAMPLSERAALGAFVKKGVGLSLLGMRSLRADFGELAAEGVRTIRFDARRFIETPESFTDFHTSDVGDYLRRFGVDAIATGVHTEDQLLTLLEDGIGLAQGPHIAGPGPARPDLVVTGRQPVEAAAVNRAEV